MAEIVDTAERIVFDQTIPRGTPPHIPTDPFVVVVEQSFCHYGQIKSMTFSTFRNGGRIYDIGLGTFGGYFHKPSGKYRVKFQLRDGAVHSLPENEYRVYAEIDFLPEK